MGHCPNPPCTPGIHRIVSGGGCQNAGVFLEIRSDECFDHKVRRFTDQAATAGVLTECDFAELDDMNLRRLFVGLTRARIHL